MLPENIDRMIDEIDPTYPDDAVAHIMMVLSAFLSELRELRGDTRESGRQVRQQYKAGVAILPMGGMRGGLAAVPRLSAPTPDKFAVGESPMEEAAGYDMAASYPAAMAQMQRDGVMGQAAYPGALSPRVALAMGQGATTGFPPHGVYSDLVRPPGGPYRRAWWQFWRPVASDAPQDFVALQARLATLEAELAIAQANIVRLAAPAEDRLILGGEDGNAGS